MRGLFLWTPFLADLILLICHWVTNSHYVLFLFDVLAEG